VELPLVAKSFASSGAAAPCGVAVKTASGPGRTNHAAPSSSPTNFTPSSRVPARCGKARVTGSPACVVEKTAAGTKRGWFDRRRSSSPAT
jgi:hypothetical protein